jgi:hypothetical protein
MALAFHSSDRIRQGMAEFPSTPFRVVGQSELFPDNRPLQLIPLPLPSAEAGRTDFEWRRSSSGS